MTDIAWSTGRPPDHGYYLGAWRWAGRRRVSELWFNPDAIGTGWFSSRGYLNDREPGYLETIPVEAWVPMPKYPPADESKGLASAATRTADADATHNDGPEMRARLAMARRAADAAAVALASEEAEQPAPAAHDHGGAECGEECYADGPREGAVLRRMALASPQTQNKHGEWVPAIPLPLYGWRKQCGCGRRFWTESGYRGHYALAHILGTP